MKFQSFAITPIINTRLLALERIVYAYKMKSIDINQLGVITNRKIANYTNLLEWENLLAEKVSSSNTSGRDPITELDSFVIQPFWENTWFPFMIGLVFTTLVLAYISYRTSFLNRQKKKLELQTEDLERKNIELKEHLILIEGQKVRLEDKYQQIAFKRDKIIEQINLTNQSKLRFFTNVSHEFRTPLTLIIDPLEQLIEKYENDKSTSNTLCIINRNARRLSHLIDQLINFRVIENERMQLNVCRGNLVKLLHEIFDSFTDLAKHRGIKYEFKSDQKEHETWIDSEKIENVFYNLLSNAFKFSSVSGNIKMKVEFIEETCEKVIQPPFVAISIKDSGSGIEACHLPHIFERFYISEQSKKSTCFTSSGIGLALTHEIVQALHGKIEVQSKKGEGSTFTVYLPYSRERFQPNEINENTVTANINIEGRVKVLSEHIIARELNYEQEGGHEEYKTKSTILIVEDNFDLRNFLMQNLRTEYFMLCAENGKIGLEMAKKYSPDLIISDIIMPVMDGLKLCRQLKKTIQTSHIPIILLTAKDLVENRIAGLEIGADDYIPKPFNLQVLQAKIKNLIEIRRKLKRMFCAPDQYFSDKEIPNRLDKEFLKKLYEVLEKNYTNSKFSANHLSEEMLMSHSLLYKKIKAITNM
ncbi:MAG TPA: response regulator, partial [Draconibacterium sp.]|nr:response regulator [Draconibacterium sp.]